MSKLFSLFVIVFTKLSAKGCSHFLEICSFLFSLCLLYFSQICLIKAIVVTKIFHFMAI